MGETLRKFFSHRKYADNAGATSLLSSVHPILNSGPV